eukprot:TRINITY_DN836_c1_g1_i1.p1 TRINITY_DN836_c1_g1~~TRINITY_DN836_c1_g1_i1.p1  ORF type:complete len:186 (+),score=24.53 TRINITY_DN836_c1_g1_i1:59-616(+)
MNGRLNEVEKSSEETFIRQMPKLIQAYAAKNEDLLENMLKWIDIIQRNIQNEKIEKMERMKIKKEEEVARAEVRQLEAQLLELKSSLRGLEAVKDCFACLTGITIENKPNHSSTSDRDPNSKSYRVETTSGKEFYLVKIKDQIRYEPGNSIRSTKLQRKSILNETLLVKQTKLVSLLKQVYKDLN